MIQIRNVPDHLHEELKARAARDGLSLSDYLKRELEQLVSVASLAQVFEELTPHRTEVDAGTIERAVRETRR